MDTLAYSPPHVQIQTDEKRLSKAQLIKTQTEKLEFSLKI